MWWKLLWIAVGGAAGTLCRYGLSGLVQRLHESGFAWGTLVVNALGCLLFGLVWSLAEDRLLIGAQARAIVLIGFLGAFTTFSTYAFESVQMMRDTQWLAASANVLAQNVLGVGLVLVGLRLGQWGLEVLKP